jgi:DNA-binding transcriptional ArsR family regulator
LRAIAHPLRSRILHELTSSGPMRAADVAKRLGVAANSASFHLRQLARYGLIEVDPEVGRDRRDRFWRAVSHDGVKVQVEGMATTPEGRAAMAVWSRQSQAWAQAVVRAAYSYPGGERESGESAYVGIGDSLLRLDAADAAELNDELSAVLDRWRERTRGREDGETYVFLSVLLPDPGRGV